MSDTTTDWLSANAGGNGGPGVYFGTPGDKVVGVIEGTPHQVTTEFGDRLVIELVASASSTASKGTNGEEGPIADGDSVTLWCKPGAMAAALKKALADAGARGLTEGDTIAVQYTGDGERSKPGWNPPKLYAAKYVPATPSVSLDDLV
jgi:hypothetical protein